MVALVSFSACRRATTESESCTYYIHIIKWICTHVEKFASDILMCQHWNTKGPNISYAYRIISISIFFFFYSIIFGFSMLASKMMSVCGCHFHKYLWIRQVFQVTHAIVSFDSFEWMMNEWWVDNLIRINIKVRFLYCVIWFFIGEMQKRKK